MKRSWFLICLFLISGCSSKPIIIDHTDRYFPESKDISIVNHGRHTGFVIPANKIQSSVPELSRRFQGVPYLEFGWGDKELYQSKENTSSLAFQAIFWPTESVVHVVALTEIPEIYFPDSEVVTLCISNRQYALLVDFISNSFRKDKMGKIIKLKNGIYGNSQFYQGEEEYYLFNTCNKWTAKGLKSAGFNIKPAFKLTAGSIMTFLTNRLSGIKRCSCSKNQNVDLESANIEPFVIERISNNREE